VKRDLFFVFGKMLLALAVARAAASGSTIFFTSAPGPAIPDNNTTGVNLSIIIPATAGYVIDPGDSVTVTLNNMNHTWIGDLRVILTGPGGIVRTVFDRPGVPGSTFGCGGNLVATNSYSFNSGAATGIAATCPTNIPGGTYRTLAANDSTNTNLSSAWTGIDIAGTTWTLNIADLAAADLQSAGWTWTLTMNVTPNPEPATTATVLGGLTWIGFRLWRRRRPKPEPAQASRMAPNPLTNAPVTG
jgi:subtilisin-like proprotein convertase family protein